MASMIPEGVAPQEWNDFILASAKQRNWLNADQMQHCSEALAANPDESAITVITLNAWLREDHIEWLEHQARLRFGLTSAEDDDTVSESEAQVVEDYNFAPLDVDIQLHEDRALQHINHYLWLGQYYGASDVHVGVGSPPIMRRNGCLQPMWPKAPPMKARQTERLMLGFLDDKQKKRLNEIGDLDFCYEVPDMGRFRTSVVRQRLGLDGVFRIINSKVRTFDELGLPEQLRSLTTYHNGLILVTGPVGSGKSTTLAAMVEEINKTRKEHIITLEDPIEYVFTPKSCQITQREVHLHTHSFATALRAALREDPDVVMVGEMRDLETISLAITASETGHLVLGTLHTGSAARTLDRVLDVFPVDQQAQIRTMVAGSLRGIVSQQLIPRADGQGRVLAMEILINTTATSAAIREGKTHMIPSVMQTAKRAGCQLMDESIMEFLEAGMITANDAFDAAHSKTPFRQFLNK
jgi:twitching motility protein PilT